MTHEMFALVQAFGYTLDDLRWFTINAMKSAFLPFDQRLAIINEQIKPRYAEPAPQYAPPPRTGTDTNTKLAQLRELAQLRDSGVLDEAEFELQKSQILNS